MLLSFPGPASLLFNPVPLLATSSPGFQSRFLSWLHFLPLSIFPGLCGFQVLLSHMPSSATPTGSSMQTEPRSFAYSNASFMILFDFWLCLLWAFPLGTTEIHPTFLDSSPWPWVSFPKALTGANHRFFLRNLSASLIASSSSGAFAL